jgi:hypothetical protein
LQVLERREVRPQLGLLKSTMLQLDSAFSEKAYGANSFSDFVEKLKKAGHVNVSGGEGRYMILRKGPAEAEKTVATRPELSLPVLRDVLETHRLEVDNGCPAEQLADWVKTEHPNFDWKSFGFQEFSEMLNYAQDKHVVRIEPNEEKGLLVYLGPEFHPPAPVVEPEPEPVVIEEPEEKQPYVPGQPSARTPKPRKTARKTATGEESAAKRKPRRTTTRKKTEE